MKSVELSNLFITGDLGYRSQMNYNRLESEIYKPEHLFKAADYDWPGDFEGRTILALVLLAQATHREPQHLAAIMEQLPQRLNDRGYFGRILPVDLIDEQQLSGNSWFLRALCETYKWKQEKEILMRIERIVQHLLLPTKGYYREYPAKKEERKFEGEAIGAAGNQAVKGWFPSTDIGCAFIMLDGASQAYEILGNVELAELMDEMIEVFLSIDPIELSLQTHATLSALRGMLRYYEQVNRPDLLDAIQMRYDLYAKTAMTENYANYNWFGRPDWTEPCAVIDSFLLTTNLWRLTGDSRYLHDAHHIWYNAIGHGQRPNGGFGCDICAGAGTNYLQPIEEVFEAFWCCTMRGGEGLAKAIENSFFTARNSIIISFYHSAKVRFEFIDGYAEVEQISRYPFQGEIVWKIHSSTLQSRKLLRFYMPKWVHYPDVQIIVNGNKVIPLFINDFAELEMELTTGTEIQLAFPIGLRRENILNAQHGDNHYTFRHGDLILGTREDYSGNPIEDGISLVSEEEALYRIDSSGQLLAPVGQMIYLDTDTARTQKNKIIYKTV